MRRNKDKGFVPICLASLLLVQLQVYEAGGSAMIRTNVISGFRNILRWETLKDDLENGSFIGVITAFLICVAMILFSP